LGKPVHLRFPPTDVYAAPGVQGLTDGYVARSADFLNLTWLGIEGKNLEATIDLGAGIEIKEVGVHFLQQMEAGIQIPPTLEVWLSDDGKQFRKAAVATHKADQLPVYMKTLSTKLANAKARYVRVIAPTNGQWLCMDEVIVNPEQ
jgi:hypothetical protein